MTFLTHEVGSLAKPEWRVRAGSLQELRKKDLEEAVVWGKKLNLNYQELLKLLKKPKLSPEDITQVKQWSSRYALRLEERAGLAAVYDGEQQRSEMYHYPVSHSSGFVFVGHVRSFDHKFYQKAAVVGQPAFRLPYHLEEFRFAKSMAHKPLKVPITGAYTLADWSYDEYYLRADLPIGTVLGQKARVKARCQFTHDVARELIRPNILALVEAGANWVQIDEPAVTTHPEEVPLFVEAFNLTTRDINCRFSIHICFSDYNNLFPHIHQIENCHEYTLEFANRDSKTLGISANQRPGYQFLTRFKKERVKARLGLGVIDIHTDFIEPPKLVRDRILYGVKILGSPDQIYVTTDCGLRTRTWRIALAKLTNLVAGANLAAGVLKF